jgi:hypothetical protein
MSENELTKEETAMADALAAYLEQLNLNNGAIPDAKMFAAQYAGVNQTELLESLNLLAMPRKPLKPDVNSAWLKFSAKNFASAHQTASLGNYVQSAIATNDADLSAAKIPQASLEAMKQDQTPLAALKDYELKDYADLAKRYGVKDALFPRLLKWLKNVGKSMSNPQFGASPRAQFGFARQEDRQPDLTGQEIEKALEEDQEPKEHR